MSYEPLRELRAEQLDSISYQERGPKRAMRRKRAFKINPRLIFAFAVLGALGFGGFKGIQWLLKDDATPVPVLTPEVSEENIKSRPLETENTKIPNSDKTIYREFEGASHDKSVEQLLEEPEVPEVLMDQHLQAQKEAEAANADPFLAQNVPHPEAVHGAQDPAAIAVAELFDENPVSDEPTKSPTKTSGMVEAKPVTPPQTSLDKTAPAIAQPPAEEPSAQEVVEDLPAASLPQKSLRHALAETTIAIQDDATKMIDANIHEGKPMPSLKTDADYGLKIRKAPPQVSTAPTPQPVVSEKKQPAAVPQEAPKKRGPLSFKNLPQNSAPVPAVAEEPATLQAPSGNYWLQLGSLESAQQAEQEWDRLARMSAVKGALQNKRHKIQRVDLGKSKGIFHRILVGPFPEADAKKSAQALRENKVSCIVLQK